MVGEVPRIHPRKFWAPIVTETLLICYPGCLFDTQGENVLNRMEAAAKVGQNASTHDENLLGVRPSGNSRLKLQ